MNLLWLIPIALAALVIAAVVMIRHLRVIAREGAFSASFDDSPKEGGS
jgi:hypothetical protein